MAITLREHNGHLGPKKNTNLNKFQVNEDGRVEEIHSVWVHRFQLSDADDPDMYAAFPIMEWQRTEKGSWVMQHSVESPMWHRTINFSTYGYEYRIQAWLKGADYTFFILKWGQNN